MNNLDVLRWAHTVHDATHDGKNLTGVSALKMLPKTIPFPQCSKTKGGQFSKTKEPYFSLDQQHFANVT